MFILLLAVSLSLDSFTVAVAHGFKDTKIPLVSKVIISFISILFFSAALWFGEKISVLLSPSVAKLIGIILMSCICIWMLIQVVFSNKNELDEKTLLEFSLKSVGITFKIIKNPMLCDVDKSKTINPIEAIFLGIALSVDSVSVGLGYALIGKINILAPILLGLIQFIFLCLGGFIGKKFTKHKDKNPKRLQIVPVIVMAVLIFFRIFQ